MPDSSLLNTIHHGDNKTQAEKGQFFAPITCRSQDTTSEKGHGEQLLHRKSMSKYLFRGYDRTVHLTGQTEQGGKSHSELRHSQVTKLEGQRSW